MDTINLDRVAEILSTMRGIPARVEHSGGNTAILLTDRIQVGPGAWRAGLEGESIAYPADLSASPINDLSVTTLMPASALYSGTHHSVARWVADQHCETVRALAKAELEAEIERLSQPIT